MNRLIAILLILFATSALAGSPHQYQAVVVGGQGAAATNEIDDDFSSDTSANFTAIAGGISISGGAAHGSTAWGISVVYHETELSSADHWVEAVVNESDYDGGGVIARSNGTTYYKCAWDGALIRIYRTGTYLANYNGGYDTTNTTHTLKMSVSGTGATVTVKLYVDGVERISFDDTDAARLTSGSYVGLIFDRDSSNYDATADDFKADNL